MFTSLVFILSDNCSMGRDLQLPQQLLHPLKDLSGALEPLPDGSSLFHRALMPDSGLLLAALSLGYQAPPPLETFLFSQTAYEEHALAL